MTKQTVDDEHYNIELKDILIWMLKKWKITLFLTIVVGGIIFLYEFYIKHTTQNMAAEKVNPETVSLVNSYQNELELIQAYATDSLLLQIDATNEYVSMVQYELSDIEFYTAFITQKNDIFQDVAKDSKITDRAKYIEEIVAFALLTETEYPILQISVLAKDQQTSASISETLNEKIIATFETLKSHQRNLDYSLKGKTSYITVDTDLQSLQLQRLEYINAHQKRLQNKIASLTVVVETKSNLVIMLESLAGGVLSSMIIIAVWYLLSSKIKSTDELISLYHLNILGYFYNNVQISANTAVYECIEYELEKSVDKNQLSNCLLIGKIDNQNMFIRQIEESLKKFDHIAIRHLETIGNDVTSYTEIDQAYTVILLIQIEKDSYSKIEKILSILHQKNAPLMGAIVGKDIT